MAENEVTENEIAESEGDGYSEIKMGAGWYLTITLAKSEKYDNEYIEIAKERSGVKRSRFNLNPKYARILGNALLKFADDNELK
ncbi:MAG: hypothetical protein P1P69_05255 [Methanosarcinaceae archaeon]|nr:hypothetical protein [Methanosarcinaceae archaeon]MDF1533893.1 hypothetical protein [Methanosarcinaceae archaeon]